MSDGFSEAMRGVLSDNSNKPKEIKVFISSPYTNGWMPDNVRRQMSVGSDLMDMGYYPFVPLLFHFMEMYTTRPEEDWLKTDIVFLKTCDAVLRLKPKGKNGIEINSPGGDKEVSAAKKEGIPVFYNIQELHTHFKLLRHH